MRKIFYFLLNGTHRHAQKAYIGGSAFILGFLFCVVTQLLVESDTPWAGQGGPGFYFGSLVLINIIASSFSPSHFWLAPIGLISSQFVYLLILFPSPLVVFIATVLAIHTIPSIVGGRGVWLAHRFVTRKRANGNLAT
ncbi:MAG: hypothetical protein CMO80_21390 [Verrucomicrobiales bacterium]|nr:hypothetical protein [Verrucomicrobiales bacterium]|tara:strand:+ start:272 stop:685 length:414 start_codon:yes stop_codon:yes gene_type:complete